MSIFFLPRLIPVASFLLGGGGDSKAVVIDGVSWWSEATEAVRGSKPATLEGKRMHRRSTVSSPSQPTSRVMDIHLRISDLFR
jgi:hypothetical protein